jgi:hypothetical protein
MWPKKILTHRRTGRRHGWYRYLRVPSISTETLLKWFLVCVVIIVLYMFVRALGTSSMMMKKYGRN